MGQFSMEISCVAGSVLSGNQHHRKDVFNGGLGDDIYDGAGGDYNQVDLEGHFADYTFTNNADGTLVASHAEYGEDILKNIDGIWIGEDNMWVSTDDLVSATA